MTDTIMLILAAGAILSTAGAAIMVVALRRAPDGIETAEGFHAVETESVLYGLPAVEPTWKRNGFGVNDLGSSKAA